MVTPLQDFIKLGCNLSIRIPYLHSHSAISRRTLAIQVKNAERGFIGTLKKWSGGTSVGLECKHGRGYC